MIDLYPWTIICTAVSIYDLLKDKTYTFWPEMNNWSLVYINRKCNLTLRKVSTFNVVKYLNLIWGIFNEQDQNAWLDLWKCLSLLEC